MSDDKHIIERYNGRRILVAPLNWGLGHATRSVAIIKRLSKDNHICIASDGLALTWLKRELGPRYCYYNLPSYNVKYDQANPWVNLLKYGPAIRRAIGQENKQTSWIVNQENIDLIISDHRLGVRQDGIESIIVSHQLKIPHQNSFISMLTTRVQRSYVNQFDRCWVPDYHEVEQRLSGILSEPSLKIAKQYIGPLSHLSTFGSIDHSSGTSAFDVAIVLSGLEPARSVLEEKLTSVLSQMKDIQTVCVRGSTPSSAMVRPSNIKYHDILVTKDVNKVINQSKVVIARSGYSTIMDLNLLKKKAILIPTPNQPEQEYLASIHGDNLRYTSILEEDITVEKLKSSLHSLL